MRRTDFTNVAPFYRWLEYLVFGNALQRRRCAFLQEIVDARAVLILGDGDGRFAEAYLRLLHQSDSTAEVELVDCSPGMLCLAKRRLRKAGLLCERTEFRLQDVRCESVGGPYDLVVSHFFLDCFSTAELRELLPRIATQTTPQARWLLSEFHRPTLSIWRGPAKLLLSCMYFFFRVTAGLGNTRLPDYSSALVDCDFGRVKQESALGGLLVSQLWRKHSQPT